MRRLILFLWTLLPRSLRVGLVRVVFSRTTRQLKASIADVETAQRSCLLDILARNKDTAVGIRYGFGFVSDVNDFRSRVPIQTYKDVGPNVQRMLTGERNVLVGEDTEYFSTTSGTTGPEKLLPAPPAFVRECGVTNRILYRTLLSEFPELLSGKRLSMRSPTTKVVAPGIQAGSVTQILSRGGRDPLGAVPEDVFFVEDFEVRYFLCLRFALQERVTVASAVNPSTLMLFAQTLARHADDLMAALMDGTVFGTFAPARTPTAARLQRLAEMAKKDVEAARRIEKSRQEHGTARMQDVFPSLVGLVTWMGGSAALYLKQLEKSYGALPIIDYGYVASEGCFGAPIAKNTPASLLVPHAHFLEFSPVDEVEKVRQGTGQTKLLHELETGQEYFVFCTTSGGLYRYDMNDVVAVVGHNEQAPLAVFRHKGGAMSSLTGEKLSEAHVVSAMSKVDAALEVKGFCVAPMRPNEGGVAGYVLAVDCESKTQASLDVARLASEFDERLQDENMEYKSKRVSLRLAPMEGRLLPADAIVRYRKSRVRDGAPDAHVKIPHISPDGGLLLGLGFDDEALARRFLQDT